MRMIQRPRQKAIQVGQTFLRSYSARPMVYLFDPNGPVSKLWLATGAKTGRFPRLVDVVLDGPRRHFVFGDGSVILADGTKPVVLLDKIAA